jgi:flavin reductase (DIM6/NTAB) family NADH-FMN oxidoreductase RutF
VQHSVQSDPVAAPFRGAAGQLASGAAVVITMVAGRPHAATASSGVVVSAEPPLHAFFFAAGSRMHGALSEADAFTASFLRAGDFGLARRFASPARATGWPGLAGVDLLCRDPAPPVLANAMAWFDCRLHQVVPMGTIPASWARSLPAAVILPRRHSSTIAAASTAWDRPLPRRRGPRMSAPISPPSGRG